MSIKEQTKKLIEVIEKEIEEMNISCMGMDRLLSSSDEWIPKIIGILRKKAGSDFESLKVPSSHVYPPNYHGAKPIGWQINEVSKKFGVNGNKAQKYAKTLTAPPEGFEYFAIPRYQVLGIHCKPYENEYGVALKALFDLIPREHSFIFYEKNMEQYLKIKDRTQKGIKQLERKQPDSDIIILPVNLGMKYRGFANLLSESLFEYNEAGIWSFAMGTIVGITHPELASTCKYLSTYCSGESNSDYVPLFFLEKNKLGLGQYYHGFSSANYGSGSFLF